VTLTHPRADGKMREGGSVTPEARERAAWIVGAVLVVLAVVAYLWAGAGEQDPLPAVYSVL
jgi:hypothetical protein